MTEPTECEYTGLKCGLNCNCTECWLEKNWSVAAEEYYRDMLEENPFHVYRFESYGRNKEEKE